MTSSDGSMKKKLNSYIHVINLSSHHLTLSDRHCVFCTFELSNLLLPVFSARNLRYIFIAPCSTSPLMLVLQAHLILPVCLTLWVNIKHKKWAVMWRLGKLCFAFSGGNEWAKMLMYEANYRWITTTMSQISGRYD